jgi:hypothetical protein
MVQIHDHYIPTEFMVLGRPFLNTTRAIIYMRSGEVYFRFPSEKVRFYFNSYTTYGQPKKNKFRRRRRAFQRRKNQLLENKEEKIEETGEPEKDESPTSTLSLPTKQVWKKKKRSSSSSPLQEVQPGSPFQASDVPCED